MLVVPLVLSGEYVCWCPLRALLASAFRPASTVVKCLQLDIVLPRERASASAEAEHLLYSLCPCTTTRPTSRYLSFPYAGNCSGGSNSPSIVTAALLSGPAGCSSCACRAERWLG